MGRLHSTLTDPTLSGLATASDVDAIAQVFQRELPGFAGGPLHIDRLKLVGSHHKPGVECRLLYALRVSDAAHATHGRQLLLGIVAPAGTAAAAYEKALREPHSAPALAPAVHFIRDLGMVVWGFPNDPALRSLRLLLDARELTRLLSAHWRSLRLPPEARLLSTATEVIKYKPCDRCTLRHVLTVDGRDHIVVYSKTLTERNPVGRLFGTMQALRDAPVCQSRRIVIPEPLFVTGEMQTLFVRGLDGVSADDDVSDLEQTAATIGGGLADLHQCSIDGLPRRADEAHARSQLAEAAAILGTCDPSYKDRVESLTAELLQRCPGLTRVPARPIHGACRLSNFLLVGGKPALLDFDDVVLSNPICDVGSFVAYLLFLPLREKSTPERSLSASREFCRAYAGRAPWGLPADVLAWQTVVHLVAKEAKKHVKRPKAHAREAVATLLHLASAVLAGRVALL